MTIAEIILACSLFLIIAILYSSVGHAGSSGYLALMALLSFAPVTIKPTSLVLMHLPYGLGIGGIIGLISGLIGVGGDFHFIDFISLCSDLNHFFISYFMLASILLFI